MIPKNHFGWPGSVSRFSIIVCNPSKRLFTTDNHVLLTMYREFLNVKKPFSSGKLSSVITFQTKAYRNTGDRCAEMC